jgi:drug/metabolite transporter (DMT)-like permease
LPPALHLLIPAGCAILYVLAALTLKRAAGLGVGVWRTTFVANWMVCLTFVPWWFWRHGTVHPLTDYWQPAITALTFLGGQLFIFLAISRGDVSVTTPVMGLKVIFVALLSHVLHAGEVPLQWWAGAVGSAGAVVLLHAGEPHARRQHLLQSAVLAALSAVSYSLGDVLLQKWVPAWGSGSYLPPMFLLTALYSFAFVPFFHGPLRALSGEAWRWVGLGAALLALNNAGIVLAIGLWGGATAVNIIYSARGLVSVGLLWAFGHWFASEERHLQPRVLRFRLAGAVLMLAAIVLVLV